MKTTPITSLRLDGRTWTCNLECGCTVARPLRVRARSRKILPVYAPGEFGKPWALSPGHVRHACPPKAG